VGAWGRGSVTLIGDAAHPSTPNLGQGGAAALEDALELGQALQAALQGGYGT
jgi:2-polyprenyl-6-methoxyphenol hydroxylase-like FAD-dependent oxidoreductase